MSDGISFQTWICPTCHDDHKQGGACTPVYDAKFSPAKDDRSYIAEKYRELESEVARLRGLVERMKPYLLGQDHDDRWLALLADLEKGQS